MDAWLDNHSSVCCLLVGEFMSDTFSESESFPKPAFDWDEHNINHIAQHDVTPAEAEQVLLNGPIDLDFQVEQEDEERWPYIGETNAGRILRVIVTLRGEKLRVVTAFEPSKQNKQAYLAIRTGQYDGSKSS
jgi:uncharacterized protein